MNSVRVVFRRRLTVLHVEVYKEYFRTKFVYVLRDILVKRIITIVLVYNLIINKIAISNV